jgi:pimeloyl-ACP methyl ester carboxylesterase
VPSPEGLVRLADVYGADHPWFMSMAETLTQHDADMLGAVMDRFDDTFAVYDTDALFPQSTCPALILQADPDHGGILTDAEVANALPLIAQPYHVRLEGIGHPLFNEDKEPALRAMTAFFEAVQAESPGILRRRSMSGSG